MTGKNDAGSGCLLNLRGVERHATKKICKNRQCSPGGNHPGNPAGTKTKNQFSLLGQLGKLAELVELERLDQLEQLVELVELNRFFSVILPAVDVEHGSRYSLFLSEHLVWFISGNSPKMDTRLPYWLPVT